MVSSSIYVFQPAAALVSASDGTWLVYSVSELQCQINNMFYWLLNKMSLHPWAGYRFLHWAWPCLRVDLFPVFFHFLTWVLTFTLPRWPFHYPHGGSCHLKPTWTCCSVTWIPAVKQVLSAEESADRLKCWELHEALSRLKWSWI